LTVSDSKFWTPFPWWHHLVLFTFCKLKPVIFPPQKWCICRIRQIPLTKQCQIILLFSNFNNNSFKKPEQTLADFCIVVEQLLPWNVDYHSCGYYHHNIDHHPLCNSVWAGGLPVDVRLAHSQIPVGTCITNIYANQWLGKGFWSFWNSIIIKICLFLTF
jgi:hypothetical protein